MMLKCEQHDEEDCLSTNSDPGNVLVDSQIKRLLWILLLSSLLENRKLCKTYWNMEQLDMWIQKLREGHIKFTCKGYNAFQIYPEFSPESWITLSVKIFFF